MFVAAIIQSLLLAVTMIHLVSSFRNNHRLCPTSKAFRQLTPLPSHNYRCFLSKSSQLGMSSVDVESSDASPHSTKQHSIEAYRPFGELGLIPNITDSLLAKGFVDTCIYKCNGLIDYSCFYVSCWTGFTEPTLVQKKVIPALLSNENVVIAAATGSGKTFAYSLPIIQMLIHQEQFMGYKRMLRRPRGLILAPTRELARQILTNIKSISHYNKISSAAVMGGEQYAIQKRSVSIVAYDTMQKHLPHKLSHHCTCVDFSWTGWSTSSLLHLVD